MVSNLVNSITVSNIAAATSALVCTATMVMVMLVA